MARYPDLTENGRMEGATDSHLNWKIVSGAVTYQGRIYLPVPLHSKVISLFHDNCHSGYFGAHRTVELVTTDFY